MRSPPGQTADWNAQDVTLTRGHPSHEFSAKQNESQKDLQTTSVVCWLCSLNTLKDARKLHFRLEENSDLFPLASFRVFSGHITSIKKLRSSVHFCSVPLRISP